MKEERYLLKCSEERLAESDIYPEVLGARYAWIHNGKAVAVLVTTNEPGVVIAEPIRTEEWWPLLKEFEVIAEDTQEDGIFAKAWDWIVSFANGGG